MTKGKVTQVIGPVVDIEFPNEHLPDILNAVTVVDEERGINVTLEVAAQIGNSTVRCIALSSTDGLVRGMEATDTRGPIHVPVEKRRWEGFLTCWEILSTSSSRLEKR